MVSAFIFSRLDYCNSVLASLPLCTTEPLQRVLNAAARLVLNLRPRGHVTHALQQLHWLPIETDADRSLNCLIMHLVHTNRAPQYPSDSVDSRAFQQSTWSQILQHSSLRQTEVYRAEPSSESAASVC